MEQPQPPLTEENPNLTGMSLGARLMNIYAAPSEVFDGVKSAPVMVTNWLVPLFTAMAVGIVFVMVVFSQPKIIQGMKDAQDKKFQEMVASGKKTQQQVDQISAITEKWMSPSVIKVFGILGTIFFSTAMLFFMALVLWLVGNHALHGSFNYMKAVEVTGLTMMISALGGLVTMLLSVIYGTMGLTAGPVLLVAHFDPSNKVHAILAALDVMSLWYLGVLSIGLAKLSGSKFFKAAIWIFVLWYGTWAIFRLGPLWLFGGK
ncbi:MAG: hypothetical protein JWR26_922 [Pedosphaera sp.]|nr:hypothetical protein [Pedosphaera sp.]